MSDPSTSNKEGRNLKKSDDQMEDVPHQATPTTTIDVFLRHDHDKEDGENKMEECVQFKYHQEPLC